MIIYSEDGTTVTRRLSELPAPGHWVQDTPEAGHYEPATTANGYFPMVEVARPDRDHVRNGFVRVGDTFEQAWIFSQERADANTAGDAATAERDAVRALLPRIRDLANDTAPLNNNAQRNQAIRDLARAVRRLIRDGIGDAP